MTPKITSKYVKLEEPFITNDGKLSVKVSGHSSNALSFLAGMVGTSKIVSSSRGFTRSDIYYDKGIPMMYLRSKLVDNSEIEGDYGMTNAVSRYKGLIDDFDRRYGGIVDELNGLKSKLKIALDKIK